jgi:antirestriction protein
MKLYFKLLETNNNSALVNHENKEIANLAERAEQLFGTENVNVMNDLAKYYGPEYVESALDNFIGQYDSAIEYAYEIADTFEVNEKLGKFSFYFDHEALLRDMEIGDIHVITTKSGVFIFNQN